MHLAKWMIGNIEQHRHYVSDTISPNLFSACLESIIRRCNWNEYGISIDGRKLNHLRFADDIVLITRSTDHASRMLEELHKEGANFGLTINMSKTKFMKNEFADENSVRVQGDPLEEVTEYVYLGRLLNMKNDLKPEILRRKKAGWAAFNSLRGVIGSVKDHALRANIFNSTVLPALCYSCETWTLTKTTEDQLRRIQAVLERKMVGISLHQQRMSGIHNDQIRAMSKVRDIVIHADEAKHHFAGHLMRRTDGRWSTATVRWEPLDKKRPVGRPPLRWQDSLAHRNNIRTLNPRPSKILAHWTTLAQDRTRWKRS
ncbi:hypothetical protein Q1695_001835 [Nippostrongylus brasiliensis]|nr:hypothetical protein Q1695_001835 [Nippostrongylus brasiliensis]